MTKDGVREIVHEELEELLTLYPTLLPICIKQFDEFLEKAHIPIKNPRVKVRTPDTEYFPPPWHWDVELEIMGDMFIFVARRFATHAE